MNSYTDTGAHWA